MQKVALGKIAKIGRLNELVAGLEQFENPVTFKVEPYYFADNGAKEIEGELYRNRAFHRIKNAEIIKQVQKVFNQLSSGESKEMEFFLNIDVHNAINILKKKPQLILQGPPGTGKTFTAEKVARELVAPKKVSVALGADQIFKEAENSDISKHNENDIRLLEIFNKKFPKEKLAQLTLQQYCQGRDKDSFCYWLEWGLKDLGKFFARGAGAFKLYYSGTTGELVRAQDFAPQASDLEAMQLLASQLAKLVESKSLETAPDIRDDMALKILNSYYPEEFFPLNAPKRIANALRILGVDPEGLSVSDANRKLMEVFTDFKKRHNSAISAFGFMRYLSQTYTLGEPVIQVAKSEVEVSGGEYKLIQFHPAYSYEDFVRGIVATTDQNGNIKYDVVDKVLAEFTEKAMQDPGGKYVLIVDEINRANLPAVLGELIYALEYRGKEVESMYAKDGDRTLVLPKNLYIIGTMNTADRSVGHIDYAIRRRFAFVDITPKIDVITEHYEEADQKLGARAEALFNEVASIFSTHLAPDFKAKDVQIGHSYFMAEDDEEIELKLEFEIKPILTEYERDGILIDQPGLKVEDFIKNLGTPKVAVPNPAIVTNAQAN